MHVGVITYQTGHLKTWQMTRKLLTKGHRVTLFAFPFSHRPPKSNAPYADRPAQLIDYDVEAFCRAHGVGYRAVGGWSDDFAAALGAPGAPDTPEIFLHCIAKIVPASFIQGRTILNCHPGLLPQNRGVDAFKWCIVNGWPFGVTLHIIDEQIDRGTILYRMRIPVFPNDELRDVCQRAYDFEGDLLANFEHHIGNVEQAWGVGDDHPVSHKSIPKELDARIEDLFLERRDLLVRLSSDPTAAAHPADQIGDFGVNRTR